MWERGGCPVHVGWAGVGSEVSLLGEERSVGAIGMGLRLDALRDVAQTQGPSIAGQTRTFF